jgi:RNA polymerase sigma-54 factor
LVTATLTLEAMPRLEQRVSPELLAYAGLLALPMAELESAVEHELEQNPALERLESLVCAVCGELRSHCSCWRPAPRASAAAGSEVDVVDTLVADQPTPAQALLEELRPLVGAGDRPILAYLVGCLDDHGFTDTTTDEVASRLQVSRARVETVLAVLRRHGPAGVGAANLRECLLLQLERIEEDGCGNRLARLIVERHLRLLGDGRWRAIADALGASRDEVASAGEFICTRLRPYASLDPPQCLRGVPPVRPDVIVRELSDHPGTFSVELVEPRRVNLVLAPAYERLPVDTLARAEREHITAQVAQARSFLGRLERRWETMRAVAEVVVARQRDYLTRGPRYMKRLTRAEVAAAVGVHESTVSRATNDRYVLLPCGRIIPFARFFERAQGPCAALAQLIADEPQPRSDAALAEELTRLGYPLARRTVAKYRERLGIPRHTER